MLCVPSDAVHGRIPKMLFMFSCISAHEMYRDHINAYHSNHAITKQANPIHPPPPAHMWQNINGLLSALSILDSHIPYTFCYLGHKHLLHIGFN